MRRTVASGVIAGAVMVGGLWTWRSPTVTLVRLKLALDRHDLAGVESAVDFDALTGAALSGLLGDRAGRSETVRLALLRSTAAHAGAETALGTSASAEDVALGDERFTMGADEAELLAHTVPAPRHRAQQPFARRLEDGSWTVQVASTTDAMEAEAEREWFSRQKEPAFLLPGTVRGTTWQRV